MKILLIHPPARSIEREDIVVPPLGLASIGAVLEQDGHEVEILDGFGLGMTWNEFEADLDTRSPDIVGLTGMTPVIDTTWRALDVVREKKKGKYVVLGGAHVASSPKNVAKNWRDGVDFAVNGEGEYIMRDLVRKLDKGEDVSDMPGLIFRDQINPEAPGVDDLDALPFPARHLLPNDRYHYSLMRHAPVTTAFSSRGCPYPCTFCDKSVFGSGWRVRSPKDVVDEMVEISEQYGIRSMIFYDDLFTLRKKRVVEVCQEIVNRGVKIEWKCEGRVDTVDKDTLDWMERAGCTLIAFGVESGNQAALDYLKKGTTPEKIRQSFELTRKSGIRTLSYFILGIPVDTYEIELETIEFAKQIKTDYAQFSVLSPFPGTKVYDWAVEQGIYREIDAQNPVDKDLKRPVAVSENWTEEQLTKIVHVAHRKFYLRPSYILGRLFKTRSWSELKATMALGSKVLRWCFKTA